MECLIANISQNSKGQQNLLEARPAMQFCKNLTTVDASEIRRSPAHMVHILLFPKNLPVSTGDIIRIIVWSDGFCRQNI